MFSFRMRVTALPMCGLRFFELWRQSVCMRSKAWLAASVWLRLARLPPPASRLRRLRRLRDTLAAAPGLLVHASVTDTVIFCPMGPKLRPTALPMCCLRFFELC